LQVGKANSHVTRFDASATLLTAGVRKRKRNETKRKKMMHSSASKSQEWIASYRSTKHEKGGRRDEN